MLRRRIAGTVCSAAALALLGLAVVPGVATASAPAATSPSPSSATSTDSGGYPAQGPLLTVSSATAKVGGSITVTGHGFQSGEAIDISVTYTPASHALGSGPVAQPAAFTLGHSVGQMAFAAHAVAAPDGAFSAQVQLTKSGNATITATGEQSHLSVVANVSVLPAARVVSATSTRRTLPLSKIELLIGALAIVALLAAAQVRWKRSRRPSVVLDIPGT